MTKKPVHLVKPADAVRYEIGDVSEFNTLCGLDASRMSAYESWTMYQNVFFKEDNRCPECEDHPDLALELLAGAGEDPEPNNLSFSMNTRTGRLTPIRPNYQTVPRIHKVYID